MGGRAFPWAPLLRLTLDPIHPISPSITHSLTLTIPTVSSSLAENARLSARSMAGRNGILPTVGNPHENASILNPYLNHLSRTLHCFVLTCRDMNGDASRASFSDSQTRCSVSDHVTERLPINALSQLFLPSRPEIAPQFLMPSCSTRQNPQYVSVLWPKTMILLIATQEDYERKCEGAIAKMDQEAPSEANPEVGHFLPFTNIHPLKHRVGRRIATLTITRRHEHRQVQTRPIPSRRPIFGHL